MRRSEEAAWSGGPFLSPPRPLTQVRGTSWSHAVQLPELLASGREKVPNVNCAQVVSTQVGR